MTQEKHIQMLERRLQREILSRKAAERILEDKSLELYNLSHALELANDKLKQEYSIKSSEYSGVFESLIDAFVLIDLDGNVKKMNEAAIRLFGFQFPEESLNVKSIIYEADSDLAFASFADLISKGKFRNYEGRIYTKSKSVKLVNINASLIYNYEGEPIGAQGIVRDITEERMNQKLVVEQQQQLTSIVESSDIGIVLIKEDKIIRTNTFFRKLFSYSIKQIDKLTFSDFIKNKIPEGIDIEQWLRTPKDYVEFVNNKNEVFWGQLKWSLIDNIEGGSKSFLILIDDVTEKLNADKQKERLLEDLENKNKELRDFAHLVSHDLKSPLRSISALLSWFREDHQHFFDESSNETFELLLGKVDKMDHLINGILKYAEIDRVDNRKHKIDLNILVKDIIDMIYVPKHISVEVKNKLPVLLANRFKVQQVFQNLLSNAVNYIDKDEGFIEISSSETHSHWCFSVSDNGIGIEEKYQDKIFKIFQKLGNNERSSGIGLSIVEKIISIYNGRVWLESEVGKGTTFYFTLKK